jgi:hypothetical protein
MVSCEWDFPGFFEVFMAEFGAGDKFFVKSVDLPL